jgi:hypothetical protein
VPGAHRGGACVLDAIHGDVPHCAQTPRLQSTARATTTMHILNRIPFTALLDGSRMLGAARFAAARVLCLYGASAALAVPRSAVLDIRGTAFCYLRLRLTSASVLDSACYYLAGRRLHMLRNAGIPVTTLFISYSSTFGGAVCVCLLYYLTCLAAATMF